MSADQKEVDFFIVGLGVPKPDNHSARENAGWIFLDYFSNCMCMQTALIAQAKLSHDDNLAKYGEKGNPDEIPVVPKYDFPKYTRVQTIGVDILDIEFALTADDVSSINPAYKLAPGKKPFDIEKSYRLILIKPFTTVNDTGRAVKEIIARYNPKDLCRQLIVISEDPNTLPGAICFLPPLDPKPITHLATDSISKALSIPFFRLKIGVGKSGSPAFKNADYVKEMIVEQKELDQFGHALDLSAQALQYYAYTKNSTKTCKKYSNLKKLPSKLRTMQGVVFPVTVVEEGAISEVKE